MADRCKFEKYQYQVSYDSGSTWENVKPIQVRKGNITEYMSTDCSEVETLYRWVNLEGTYLCDGNNKYIKQIQEESYDNGVTWYTSYPIVYQRGTFVGVDEEYCADKFVGNYVPTDTPTGGGGSGPRQSCILGSGVRGVWDGKKCVYVDPLKVVKCNDSSVLTSADTTYYINYYLLIEAHIGDCVTSIGNGAFSSCTGLTSINIPDNVTSIDGSAFSYCSGLTSCTIGSGVTSIGNNAFYGCRSLTSIDIPSGVTSIKGGTFDGCRSLTSIDIPNSVTSIGGYSFSWCTSLTSIAIPSGVTTIGNNAFERCTGLTTIDIPDSVTSISSSAFTSCYSITTCTIGSGVTSIAYDAFKYCTGLTAITINAVTPPALGSDAFKFTSNCPIYVPCNSIRAYRSASGWSNYTSRIQGIPPCYEDTKFLAYYNNQTNYSVYCDLDTILGTATTRAHSTSYTAMTSCIIGDCVTSIDEYAFYDCRSLTSCTIGSGVTSIGYRAFNYCSGLTSIDMPNSIASIDQYAFERCSGMTTCTIGTGVTSIGERAFYYCSGLTSITINATTPPTLGSNVFYGTTSNLKIYVPCESLETYRETSGWSNYASRIYGIPPCYEPTKLLAYYSDSTIYSVRCDSNSGLTSATTRAHSTSYTAMTRAEIGDCVTSIGVSAFKSCTSLTSVTISTGVTSIGESAFQYCDGLTSCTIPTGVTSIGAAAFSWCSSLTSINIPNSVTSIGEWAFGNCSSLTSVTVNATTPPILGNYAFNYTNCPIYVPSASVSAYQSAWSAYSSRIQAIPT